MSYIGNTQQNQNYVPAVDFFSGNGSTTAFTLSKPVATTAQIQAVISNVPQTPGVAYTVSGSTITFTSAPPSGTNNIYVYYTSPNTQVVQPSQGTVYPSSLSTGGPSWDTAGNLTLDNGAADGAQLVLKSSGYSDWNWDNYNGRLRAYYGGTEYFTINSSGNVGIGTSSPSNKLDIAGQVAKITNTGVAEFIASSSGGGGNLEVGVDASGNSFIYTGQAKYMAFSTSASESMRIDSSGNLLVGRTSVLAGASKVSVESSSGWQMFLRSTANSSVLGITNGSGTGSYTAIGFYNNGESYSGTGYIAVSGSSTTYATSSDYRLKENIQPMQNALGVVAQLNPVTYTWKADGSDGQGFIAHELQAVVPDCVTGEKDAVDAEGNPVYQGIDTSFLVATLTKAIQELNEKVEAQAAEIAALKGAA